MNKPGRALFVGATDTEVGKTLISALLVDYWQRQGLETGYLKWAATGSDGGPPADWREVTAMLGLADATDHGAPQETVPRDRLPADQAPDSWQQNPELAVPYHFRLAASPHLAAEAEGAVVDPQRLKDAYRQALARHERLVVEGVGGLLVPLNRRLLLLDLVAELQIPVLLVARSGLGTINHTLLSLEALRRRGLEPVGVICSDEAAGLPEIIVNDNLRTIAEMGRVPVLGRLPRCRDRREARHRFAAIGEQLAAVW